MKRNVWQKEWDDLNRKQETYILKNSRPRSSQLARLQNYVPDGLQHTLDTAFVKAFQLIFEKGTGIIEKTYDKQKREDDYKIAEFTAGLRENKKHVRAFRRQAGKYARRNLILSAAEGVGLGLVGIGLPDIPLFVSMMLKNLYELSMSFGYAYDSAEERFFQLNVIETALYSGEEMRLRDERINRICENMRGAKQGEQQNRPAGTLDDQIRRTAKALADEMLYAKFLQGMPIVGAVGGITDMTVLRRMTAYAMLKYRRRYLLDRDFLEESREKHGY